MPFRVEGGREPAFLLLKMNNDTAPIETLLAPAIEAAGFRPVSFRIFGTAQGKVLQIMIEHQHAYDEFIHGDGGITADHCAQISHSLSPILDRTDFFEGLFTLEISSPGIDRPLVGARDFRRFAGFEVRMKLKNRFQGRRVYEGKIAGVFGDIVRMHTPEKGIEIPMAEIVNAKLVLTDSLVNSTSPPNLGSQADQKGGR